MLAYTKDKIDMVGVYADQDLIINCLEKINSNKDDYDASCYLLKSDDSSVKQLPQYEKAYSLINDIIEYFKLYKAELIVNNNELEKECQDKEIAKKYYDLFLSDSILINDTEEFCQFLDKCQLTDEDRINVLIYTLKNNVQKYTKKNS